MGDPVRQSASGAIEDAGNPDLAVAAGYHATAVIEDLDNAAAIAEVAERLRELAQRLADSRLTWTAEAYGPSLTLYKMAKVRAEKDGALRPLVPPLAEVFATRRLRPAEPAK